MLRKKMTIDSISHKRAQISENVCLEIETIVPCASMSAGLGAVCNSVSASPGGSRNGRNSRSPPPAAVIRPTRAYLTAMGSRRPMGISVRRRRPGSAVDSVPHALKRNLASRRPRQLWRVAGAPPSRDLNKSDRPRAPVAANPSRAPPSRRCLSLWLDASRLAG